MSGTVKTILVVEDDPDLRALTVTLLESPEYRVLEAATADAAFRLLLDCPDLEIDLLFTDIVMPGKLDGLDLAERAQRLRPGIKLLFATGFANRLRADRDRELPGLLLKKPYRGAELRRLVRDLLGNDRPGD